MLIRIGNFAFTEVWDGVLYKKLSKYPAITDWEIRNILDFILYEKSHGRDCRIECEDGEVLRIVEEAVRNPEPYEDVPPPALITECTACPKRQGCETRFVCHVSPVENAESIFRTGKLLSAVRARGLSAATLMRESRNAARDPEDYFHYVMFAWGNCQAGDRLVMERKLGRSPNEEDLSIHFTPGVRFYFRYDELIRHPNAVIDGVLPVKVKNEVELEEWVRAIVIPAMYRPRLEPLLPDALKGRTIYVERDCKDIWDWSEKVYSIIEQTIR